MTLMIKPFVLALVALVSLDADRAYRAYPVQAPRPTAAGARVPTGSASAAAFELGTKVTTDAPGRITAIRFWKLFGDPGPHVGHLWSATGLLLATVPFTNETAMGWQEQAVLPVVRLVPGPAIVVSVNVVAGAHFPMVTNGFATAQTIGHLSTPASAGMYGTPGAFPRSPSPHDYFRDLLFEADGAPPTTTVQIGLPQQGTAAPGTMAVPASVSGLVPGSYSLALTVTDASGRPTTSAVQVLVQGYPIKAGDLPRRFAYTFVTAAGESLPSPTVSTGVLTGGPFYAALADILPGPAGTIARQVYQTVAGGTQLQFVARIADNTTTTYDVHTLDAALGANAPTIDTSGLPVAGRQPVAAPTVRKP